MHYRWMRTTKNDEVNHEYERRPTVRNTNSSAGVNVLKFIIVQNGGLVRNLRLCTLTSSANDERWMKFRIVSSREESSFLPRTSCVVR
ncbi:hypothetical protein V1477_007524 [Vespula maculifrons]|uniref:Uncharacterized protein n=1 Tax=Vespula maculifrons TaxID=7453 RepID=A0ABD2CIS2_VESMC